MDESIKKAFQEMIKLALKKEQEKDYEVIESLNTRFPKAEDKNYKIELMIIHWKESNKYSLECREMYYKKDFDIWQLGGNSALSIEEANKIVEKIDSIRTYLSNSST